MENRVETARENMDKLINSKMYEKGNQLIYELDQVNRQLRLFKDNVFTLEKELREEVRSEYLEEFKRNAKELEFSLNRFRDYKADVTSRVKADLASEKVKIEKTIRQKANLFKNIDAVVPEKKQTSLMK